MQKFKKMRFGVAKICTQFWSKVLIIYVIILIFSAKGVQSVLELGKSVWRMDKNIKKLKNSNSYRKFVLKMISLLRLQKLKSQCSH